MGNALLQWANGNKRYSYASPNELTDRSTGQTQAVSPEFLKSISQEVPETNPLGQYMSDGSFEASLRVASIFGAGAAGGAFSGGEGAATGGAETAGAVGAGGGAGGGTAMPPAIFDTGGAAMMPAATFDTGGAAMMPAATPASDPTFGGNLTETSPGTFAAPGSPSGPSMISDSGMSNLSTETAQLLGIDGGGFSAQIPGEFGGLDAGGGSSFGMTAGGSPTFGDGFDQYGYSGEVDPETLAGQNPDMGAGGPTSYLDQANAMLKKLGLSPASAGMLGLSGIQALSKPKVPQAAKTLGDQAGPGAAAANQTIQSGGASSPAWTAQKSSIDATIDQQLKEQTAQMMQQAQNSGQGADSQVTLQQINKLKTQLETQRQALYAQAQAQNVQAALQQLGISNQALSQVANAQFQASNQGKQSAAQTAQIALMLQQLANKGGGGTASLVNQGSKVSA